MRAYNKCSWLTIQSTETCGKNSVGKYCHIHNALLKKGRPLSIPCKGCGKGTQSEAMKCVKCGGCYAQQKLNNIEKMAKKRFKLVLAELIRSS
jgi:hypothetical protein